ncbi:hypothetical protein GCM10023225_17490 [Kineococcus glutinatus]|uniref:Uncharacterized protein n=1 Tax=Kineococcus glutinatus TaxID=1070872 RepID=A0ABP9HSR6_9ACTN
MRVATGIGVDADLHPGEQAVPEERPLHRDRGLSAVRARAENRVRRGGRGTQDARVLRTPPRSRERRRGALVPSFPTPTCCAPVAAR